MTDPIREAYLAQLAEILAGTVSRDEYWRFSDAYERGRADLLKQTAAGPSLATTEGNDDGKSAQADQGLSGTGRVGDRAHERDQVEGRGTRATRGQAESDNDAGPAMDQHRGDGPAARVDGPHAGSGATHVLLEQAEAAGYERGRADLLAEQKAAEKIPAQPAITDEEIMRIAKDAWQPNVINLTVNLIAFARALLERK